MFAVQKFDKRIGKVRVENDIWDIDGKQPAREIEMVDCVNMLEGGDPDDKMTGYIYNKAFNPYKAHARLQKEFLCPNTTSLPS